MKLINKKYSKLILIELCVIISLVIIFIFVHSSYVNLMPSCYWQENFGILCPSCRCY